MLVEPGCEPGLCANQDDAAALHDFPAMLSTAEAGKASWPWDGEEGPKDISGEELPARGPVRKTTRDAHQAKYVEPSIALRER